MAGILVFIEQRNGSLRKASLEALSEARRLAFGTGLAVHAVLVGHGILPKAAELGKYGASKVFVADEERLARYSAEGCAAPIRAAVERSQASALFMAATALGRDLSGRVAARLGWGCLAEISLYQLK